MSDRWGTIVLHRDPCVEKGVVDPFKCYAYSISYIFGRLQQLRPERIFHKKYETHILGHPLKTFFRVCTLTVEPVQAVPSVPLKLFIRREQNAF